MPLLLCALSTIVLARSLEIRITRSSAADLTLSPDNETIIFTALGHLFSVPSTGGQAKQLTFGPYYDNDPVFSPDGSQIAFTSDRDGSEGNIFLLRRDDLKIVQLTHEGRAGRANWTPDGKSVTFLRYGQSVRPNMAAVIVRIATGGGQLEVLTSPSRRIGSASYLSDGRLVWSVIERDSGASDYVSRLETMDSSGTVSTLRTIPGLVDRIVGSNDGLYCQRRIGSDLAVPTRNDFIRVPLEVGPVKEVAPISTLGRFAISTRGEYLFTGDEGGLWKITLSNSSHQVIQFQADVKLDIQDIPKPVQVSAPSDNAMRAIITPRLSPDGRTLVFGAIGYLWQQKSDGGKAERISQGSALESEPTFSPDGHQLAFVQTAGGKDSLVLLERATGRMRLLTSATSLSELAWSADGGRIVALVGVTLFEQHVTAFDVSDGKAEQLTDAGSWSPRPQLSAGGRTLYYSADAGGIGNLYRLTLSKDAKPEQISHLSRHLSDARITPDEKWVAFRRNHSILAAKFSDSIQDRDVREISKEGGDSFALTSDGKSVIYPVGWHVWVQPLAGGARQEIPVILQLQRPSPHPLLVRGVRVLNAACNGFGQPTSMLLENGKIRWIGSESGHEVPKGAEVIDASGRFVIPGLFDLHVHALPANQEAFLAFGVTSVRDTGGSLSSLNALQDRSDFTGEPVPRYFYSGEIFEGAHPYWGDGFLQIDNDLDAREYVRRFKELGASFIKVYPSLSWPLKHKVAEEAHRLGLPVVGHGTNPEEIVKSVTLGFFSLEHTAYSSHSFDDILQLLAASGARWDPTLVVMGGDSLLLRDEPERLNERKFKNFTPRSYVDFALSSGYNGAVSTDTLRGFLDAQLTSVGRAYNLGVQLMIGTDAPNPEVFFGSSLHWELKRFVQAGLSPSQVLWLATEGGAAAVGANDLGVIAQDKVADIVLLESNPLENIQNTESVWRVIKGGWMFDPAKLPVAQ